MFNRNKKSIALDLRQPQALRRRCACAPPPTWWRENFKPGTMDKYGLDYAALGKLNPRSST
jgi:crotonobetainyl-CoA:carnitine CoA-transferase CaiB-like acyl-CoA transferase